ncbi:MAG: GDP-mannose pyrophosphatase, partial [Chryseobacterium sp.]
MQNSKVKILKTEILSDNWYTLNKITFEKTKRDGSTEIQSREAYDRGNGATILLYNKDQNTVILTKQFRLPTYINGNSDGMLIETCAGLLDNDNP